eukprot:4932320-Alexandrium_andersonii.AAC.1
MSASLVGSEMCIRDSSWWGAQLMAHGKRSGARHRTSRGPQSAEVAATAVSYTHLTLPTICSV